jgi:hypothetical protein
MKIDLNTLKRIFSLFLYKHCYEILLVSFLLHLYGSVFFRDVNFYGIYIQILNLLLVYLAAINTFFHRRNNISILFRYIILVTLCCNFALLFFNDFSALKYVREVLYLIFLLITIYKTASFLIMPHRIDKALISASIVGYLLLIEIATQLFIIFFLIEGKSVLSNINLNNATNTYIDIVYYCTVTATSIGFGDILPLNHSAKMTTSLLGLAGQFYLVIIMSVMISKFTSKKVA